MFILNCESRPRIAVTIGDPAGIGPEVVLCALKNPEIYEKLVPIVIGSLDLLTRCISDVGISDIRLTPIAGPENAVGLPGTIEIIDVPVPGVIDVIPGKVQTIGGAAADAYIRKACELAMDHKVDAISTAPISKESLRAAGIPEIGHTELLAKYMNSPDPLTLFITENMRIFFLSRHFSLKDAIDYITEERLLTFMRRVDAVMKDFGFVKPHIAVAALNPHAGDGGQFGDEEVTIISPAISTARSEGIDMIGPIGADSVFNQALEGKFDCVISLYHDQGHIAAKTRDFFRTVTATLGLPTLRTSVDHGTGFDIAWSGKASSISMEAAILAAVDLLKLVKCP